MDSLNQSSKKLPSLRTYAKDLEHTRKEKNLPAEIPLPEEASVKTPPAAPRKKEPLITATPVPKPKLFARKESIKAAPALKPLPAKMPLPKLPTFTAPDNTTFIVDNEDAAVATIITDTKRDRFKLLPSLFASIKQWFTDQKKARAVKNAPKYTVPETTRRKGVIQKATSTTGKSATADFASIQERIKQRKAHVEKAEPHTTWSANTEPVFLLLEGEVVKPVTNVQLVSRKSFRTAPVAPAPSIVPVAIPTPVPVAAIVPAVTPAPESIVSEVPEPVSAVSVEPEELVFSKDSSTRHTFLSLNTNLLALSFSGVALVLIIAITFSYVTFTKNSEVTTTATLPPSALLQTSSFSPILDTPLVHEALIAKLAVLATENPAVISEFAFTNTSEVAFTPQEIIATLEIPVDQNFAQAVKTIHFGYVGNTEPYLLVEVTDEIAAQGGLLVWEESLYTDFTTVFSREAVVLSSRIKFVDGTFGGGDVRILKDDTGAEIIIYGMLGTTILITTNSRTFSEVANLIQ